MKNIFTLPCDECKGKCCTYPVFSREEMLLVKLAHGVPKDAIVTPMKLEQHYNKSVQGTVAFMVNLKSGVCPYLKEGKCSIYNLRPKVCKDYGNVPDLPCEYLYPKQAADKQAERIRKSRI